MSYIAVDTFGDEYIYQFKPKRVIRIEVPKGTAKALYNANLMTDCKIPFQL